RRAPFDPIPHDVEYAYRQGINRLLMRPPVDLVLGRDALEENASQFNAFMELEDDERGSLTLWISKAPQNMLRLAGLIHLASLPDEETPTEVGPEAVRAAAEIVRA